MDQIRALETKLEKQVTALSHLISTQMSPDEISNAWTLWDTIAAQEAKYIALQHEKNPEAALHDLKRADYRELAARRAVLRFGHVRATLWPVMRDLLARLTAHEPTPLVTSKRIEWVKREHDLTSYLMSLLHDLANPAAADSTAARTGEHQDIGLSGLHFIELMTATSRLLLARGRPRPWHFLDVGCGGGSKVMTAASFFEEAHGLEFNPVYAAHAKASIDRLGLDGCEIYEDDALHFRRYSRYDVIYMYRPISEPALQAQLEAAIFETVPAGTVVVAPFSQTLYLGQVAGATKVAEDIYVARMSTKAVGALRQRAEALGSDHWLDQGDTSAKYGFWQPLVSAAHRCGFAPHNRGSGVERLK